MLIALSSLAVIALAALALLHAQQRAHAAQQVEWALERRELLNRVARPELIPLANGREPFEFPDQKPDEWAQAGQIGDISDDYGIGEDGS